jgi:hypothetical protein
MDRSNQLDPRPLRAIIEREQRAERTLAEAEATALLHSLNELQHDLDYWAEHGLAPLGVQASASLEPKVIRARRKLAEARVERAMAEHLLAGHLLDPEASP